MTHHRRRLLFISQTLPYPPDSGVKVRSYHTLRILSRAYDVTALCFFRRMQTGGQQGVERAVEALGEFADVTAFSIPQEWSRWRMIADHTTSLISGRPYTDYVFRDRKLLSRIRELTESVSYSIAHLESQSLGRYAPELRGIPTACVHHNVESQLMERRARIVKKPVLGRYLGHQAKLLHTAESRLCPSVDLNITVSDEDAQALRSIAPSGKFVPLPNGVDTQFFQPSDGPTEGVVLLGGTDWFPNLDGLEYFAKSVLPRLRNRFPRLPVKSVGRASPEEIRRFSDEFDMTLTGYVDDIRPHIQRARVLVVPLRVGGGSRLKILDAWAMGKAVVTTTIGCEGLDAVDGENAMIRDDPQSIAHAIIEVISDPSLRSRLGERARLLAQDQYSWDAIGDRMLEAYSSLV